MTKNVIFILIVGFLLGYIFFYKSKPVEMVVTKTDTTFIIDTVKVQVQKIMEKPKPVKIIIRDTSVIRIYERPVINDSLGNIVIRDSVMNNQLLGYSISGTLNSIREIKKIETIIESTPRNKLLIGVNLAYTPKLVSLYPSLAFIHKKG